MTARVNVPLEPTEEMLAVMCAAFNSDESISYRKIYQDMLAARPQDEPTGEAVAWRYRYSDLDGWKYVERENECNPYDCYERQPLYAHPPTQPPALAQDDAGMVERLAQQNKTLRAAQKACEACDPKVAGEWQERAELAERKLTTAANDALERAAKMCEEMLAQRQKEGMPHCIPKASPSRSHYAERRAGFNSCLIIVIEKLRALKTAEPKAWTDNSGKDVEAG